MGKRNFSDEFKAKAVDMVLAQGQSVARTCQVLGIGETALRRWIEQRRTRDALPPPTASDLESAQRQIRELQAQLADLRQERDILKKSTTYFVKELERSGK